MDTPAESEPGAAADQTGAIRTARGTPSAWSPPGVDVWGGVGWLVSEWLDNRLFLMFGILLGAVGALYLVWVRYGKP